jgi:threonine/homoserine/homoserine lactone efflux protein
MEIVLNGVVSGIFLAFLIGPVFFTILQTSIERGFWSGVFVAMGVSLSDTIYICISYLGLVQVPQTAEMRRYLAYGGGLVLFGFGVYYTFIKSRSIQNFERDKMQYRSPARLIMKGFIINSLSPMVLFFWLATVGVATSQLGYTRRGDILLFFAAIILTVLATDIVKAKLADKLRSLITPRFIRILNVALGLVLIVFAGKLILFPDDLPH